MIDKTKKRSLFVRIAFVLFAVALAFCSVSLAFHKPVKKASAYSFIETAGYYSFRDVISFPASDSSFYFFNVNLTIYSDGSVSFNLGPNPTLIDGYYSSGSFGEAVMVLPDISNLSFSDIDFTLISVSVLSGLSYSDLNAGELRRFASDTGLTYSRLIYSFVFSDFYVTFIERNTDLPYILASELISSQQTITESVTDVWSSIFTWLTTSVNSLLGILYINGELTILGVLVVMSLGISIFFLLLAVVSNFFHLRS